jgi:hypothetical protein
MYNHYVVLIDADGAARVTLSKRAHVNRFGELEAPDDHPSWNGPIPLWVETVVEVRSRHPWRQVPDNEKFVLWKRGVSA